VMLDGVRLPASAIVGGEAGWGRGWSMLAGRALDVEKLEVAAVAFGIARGCVAEAWTYAQTRQQFGKPISGHQAVRHALVDARTKLEACRHLLTYAARLATAGHPCGVESSMAKLFVAETAVEIGLACQRVVGSYALEPGCELDRGVRDLLSFPIVGGSSNMQRNNIAAMLRLKA
jgi:alkylation response protein AidB-like acyl-CoA dehydrogenase